MVNSILLTSAIVASLGTTIALISQCRKLKRVLEYTEESIAILCAQYDCLKEKSDEHKKMLEYLIDRQHYNTVMNKFMLSDTRLNFHLHRNVATQHEDYEGASMLSQSISQIEELLKAPE